MLNSQKAQREEIIIMGSSDKFCLRWNSFESNISSSFQELRNDSEFFDVTLCCDNGVDIVQAHKVILAACSPFFRKILSHQKSQPNPLLYLKGICLEDLQAALEFMYHGEVNLSQDSLNNFLAVAAELAIKGLSADTKPMFPNATTNTLMTVKRKNSIQQTASSKPQIAKRPKTSQVLTPVENKENIMDRKSKPTQHFTQIEEVKRGVAKKCISSQDLGQVKNFEEISLTTKVKKTIIKAEPIVKNTIKDHTDGNIESSIDDQANFDNENYNNGISNTDGYNGDFEDENEFEDSLGFVEGTEDNTDQIEEKGINSWV